MTSPRDDRFWELAIAVNAAFKGLLGAMGESGHICARADAVEVELDVGAGWHDVVTALVAACDSVNEGDVVVVADKVVAAALGRIGPRAVLAEPDPKTVPAERLDAIAALWSDRLGVAVTPTHLMLADEYGTDRCTLGTDDPNTRAAEIAARFGCAVDVVISDTDTGIDTRTPLIGTVTIGATPLGATAGLTMYEAMRCAVAAEFVRGHGRRIPVVVCRPADRRSRRPGAGKARPYGGFLDAAREPGVAHA